MELYNGRPEDTSGRKEKEIKVYDILDSLHIPYIRADHEAVMTMEACEEIDKALGMEICKNLFLCNRKKTSYYLLLMPGNKALKTKELSQQIPTTRLSFASGEDMEDICDWRELVKFPDLDAWDWSKVEEIDHISEIDRENKVFEIMSTLIWNGRSNSWKKSSNITNRMF